MPADQFLEQLSLINAFSLNTQSISATTTTDLIPFDNSVGMEVAEQEAIYDQNTARKLRDLELKIYVTQPRAQGYSENPPIVGKTTFTSLVVTNQRDLENCTNIREHKSDIICSPGAVTLYSMRVLV